MSSSQPSHTWPAARWAAVGCTLLIGATACSAAATTSVPQHASTTPAATATATPQSAGSGSPSPTDPPCPATPAPAGPAHTFTFPQTIGSFQQVDPPTATTELLFLGNNGCLTPMQESDYQDSQDHFVSIQAGHHNAHWTTYDQTWDWYWSDGTPVTMEPAGPLGGQVGCGTNSMGTVCTWVDNDSLGEFIGDPGMTPSQTVSDFATFREAVEHTS